MSVRARTADEFNGNGCLPNCLGLFIILLAVVALALFLSFGTGLLAPAPTSKVSILLMGTDARRDTRGPARTDTMILVTFDPATHKVVMVSIPRDLWVPIPGHGYNRINTANFFGEIDRPGHGPRLAQQVVSKNFGVPVQHYIKVQFQGFVKVIDTLGGVTVDVPRALDDSHYPTADYGYQHIHIAAGVQQMDGESALIYVRSRHSSSDFDRAHRQQQVLLAAYQKINAPLTWPRLPVLFATFLSATESDMSGAQMLGIARAMRSVGRDNIYTLVIDQNLTRPYTTPEGAQVLLPRWDAIRPRLATLLQ